MSQDGTSSLSVSSAFPPPPPFYKYFTQENLASLKAQQKLGTPVDKLPPEIQYLIPPPPPTASYRCFGDTWKLPDLLPSLPEMGIRQLYGSSDDKVNFGNDGKDDHKNKNDDTEVISSSTASSPASVDRAKELVILSKSLLMNFLELVAILGVNPSEFASKIQDLRTILINIHHLINEYRPHQARESLILVMEDQLRKCRKETEENRKACRAIRAILDAIPRILGDSSGGEIGNAAEGLPLLTLTGDGEAIGEKRVGKEDEERKWRDVELWDALKEMNLL